LGIRGALRGLPVGFAAATMAAIEEAWFNPNPQSQSL
jgi:hypothetical protein